MAINVLTQTYGSNYVNANVVIKEVTGAPAVLYSDSSGGVPLASNTVKLNGSGAFSVYAEDTKSYTFTLIRDGIFEDAVKSSVSAPREPSSETVDTSVARILLRTSAQITSPSASDLALLTATFQDTTTSKRYRSNGTQMIAFSDFIPLTTSEILAPSAAILSNTASIFKDTVTGQMYVVNSAGTALVAIFVDGGANVAATSATNAANSAASAATSATSASSSATAASTSAANASTSAIAAATSATSASNSATAASTSATNAASSATNAASSAITASALLTPAIKVVSASTYTLIASDFGSILEFTSACTITINDLSGVAIGLSTVLIRAGTGTVSVVQGTGATLKRPASMTLTIEEQEAAISVTKTAAGIYRLGA